jgi:hypothetical protein
MAPSQDFYIQPGSWRFADTAPQARATHCSGDGIYPDPVGRSPSPLRFCIFQFPISSFCFLPSSFCLLVSISPTLRSYTVIPNGAGRLFLPLSLVRFSQCRAACPPERPHHPASFRTEQADFFFRFPSCNSRCAGRPAPERPTPPTVIPNAAGRLFLAFLLRLHTRHFERSRPTFSSAFAPAKASACVERNLSSSFIGLRREESLFSSPISTF